MHKWLVKPRLIASIDVNFRFVASLDRKRLGTKVSQEDVLDPRRFRSGGK